MKTDAQTRSELYRFIHFCMQRKNNENIPTMSESCV